MDTRIKHRNRRLNAKGKRKRRRRIIKRILRIVILVIPIILVCMIGSCTKKLLKGTDESKEVSAPQSSSASILSAGDVILHEPFLTSSHYHNEDGTYDYNPIFSYVKDIYASVDLSIVNLENTISSENYTAYPLFKGPMAIATALSDNGVDFCLLANNHIYDNSSDGLSMTQDAMDENNLLYTGIRRTSSEDNYKIVDVNGIKIGIFNYTYETGINDEGLHTINALAVNSEDLELMNTFDYNDLDSFYSEISDGLDAMHSQDVDYTIAYLHWGTEYQTTENDHQQKIAQKLCDLGIDALIGGHPHVVQPIDLLTDESGEHKMLCVYSVGNHLTNQYRERIESASEGHTEDGLMVKMTLEKSEKGLVSLTDIQFIPTWTYRTEDVEDTENPEFYILPLNEPENIINSVKESSNLDIESQVTESANRTNEIIGDGVTKVKQALPIADKKSTD